MKQKIGRKFDGKVTAEFLQGRKDLNAEFGYPVPKWITFCEMLLSDGFELHLYEAKQTRSKYITVIRGEKKFRVRFSNHKPNKDRELAGNCDFFVGVNHTTVTTTTDALQAVEKFFAGIV